MCAQEIPTGLRIDVDTLRGTRLGVPGLLRILDQYRIKATFFFSVGPDNMGRHLWRLIRPSFFLKMLRSRAASLYGWDILLRGTFKSGPLIGNRCADQIRQAADAGHEIGLHAWDHHRWQMKVATLSTEEIHSELQQGKAFLEQIIGRPVFCSAAPGWRCNNTVLLAKERLGFLYNSDCRGRSIFYPETAEGLLAQAQIPTTMPTYDELIGNKGVTEKTYNDHLLSLIVADQLNVLTIHAEAEGISCQLLFQDFLEKAQSRGIHFKPLKDLLASETAIGSSPMIEGKREGREGWVSCQAEGERR